VRTRSEEILSASQQHVFLTVVSVALGFAIAFPVALLARRFRAEGAVLGVTTGLYTVPSLALFGLLLPFTGLGVPTVIIALVIYSLTILVRNVIAGLEGVPEDVRESARGMGFGPVRQLFSVELPLALPAVFAGLRIATVSTVALVTVGALIGAGGLGNLIYEGLNSVFRAQVLTAAALCVVIAVAADLLLLGVQRMLTPWQRGVQ
jgi:osmoprotectant transport system permease protein